MFDNSILNFLIEGEINLNWSSLGKLGKFFVDDLTELYHSYFSICGSMSQHMDIFSSPSNSFQSLTFCSYLAEKKHKFYSHPWPVTNQTWPDLIPLLCYNFCVWFIFRSDKQSDL